MKKQKIMAIGAHADDIEFNVVSSLMKYHERGYEVVYVMSTNNMFGNWNRILPDGTLESRTLPWYEIMPQRKLECAKAAKELFDTEPIHLDYPQRHYTDANGQRVTLNYGAPVPDCVADGAPSILTAHEYKPAVEKVAKLILEKNPEAILTHAPVDSNPEHSCTNLLVYKAFLEAQKQGYKGSLLFWLEVTTSRRGATFNLWNTFVNTDGYFERKFEAIRIHACQVPRPETLELEDSLRGKICGCESAEVFNVCHIGDDDNQGEFIKEIIKNICHFRYDK